MTFLIDMGMINHSYNNDFHLNNWGFSLTFLFKSPYSLTEGGGSKSQYLK